jgi:NNP family nitrate/nitrite transporter-like MFS transporter
VRRDHRVGSLSLRFGPKPVGLALLISELLAVLAGWLAGTSYLQILGVGLALGFAGASFAVALPLASRVYPPAHQGLAMGVAASGNSGSVLIAFLAPRIGEALGWHLVFGLMALPVLVTLVVFAAVVHAPDAAVTRPAANLWWRTMHDLLHQRSSYWLCGVYAVTFGGFVGFCSFLPIFFHDQYHVESITAGSLTALCGLAGSVIRPFGGYTADRVGGVNILPAVFAFIAMLVLCVGWLPIQPLAIPLIVVAVAAMGFGNGVIFQMVPGLFHKQMGAASGLIGAAGGLGGFCLPFGFGLLKDLTGTYGTGFVLFAGLSIVASASAFVVARRSSPNGLPNGDQ